MQAGSEGFASTPRGLTTGHHSVFGTAAKRLAAACLIPFICRLALMSRVGLTMLEAQHPTALPVGEWYCHASLVAYACCGGERTGFGYSRI